jgi:hypothetical protein
VSEPLLDRVIGWMVVCLIFVCLLMVTGLIIGAIGAGC